ALVHNRDERAISPALERNTHPRPLLANGLDVLERDIPFGLQLLGPDEHDAVVREHDEHVLALQLEVRNVVLVEVLAVVEGLEPELAERLALRVRPHDAVL